MTSEEIVHAFARSDQVPVEAIRAAEANPQMFVPAAVAMLERIAAGTSSIDEEDGLAVTVHVLADIGDRQVLPPLLNVLRLPTGDVERLLGDSVTETVGRILISLAIPEDAAAFERVMETLEADEYARSAVFDAWTWLALSGGIDRARAHAYLADFPSRVNPPKGDHAWVSWIDSVAMLGFQDLSGDVERVFAEENVPVAMGIAAMELDDFRRQLDGALADPEGWKHKREYTPFSGTVSELSAWYGYSDEYRRRKDEEAFDPLAYDEPVINPYRDVGRNDPCPCGSGKKFKKCCLR